MRRVFYGWDGRLTIGHSVRRRRHKAAQAGGHRHRQRFGDLLPVRGPVGGLSLGREHVLQAGELPGGVPQPVVPSGHARAGRLQTRPHARAGEQLPRLHEEHGGLRRRAAAVHHAGLLVDDGPAPGNVECDIVFERMWSQLNNIYCLI